MVVSDNGTEFTSNAILNWADEAKVEWHFIARPLPGSSLLANRERGQAHAERLHRELQRQAQR
jgi:putative transposase